MPGPTENAGRLLLLLTEAAGADLAATIQSTLSGAASLSVEQSLAASPTSAGSISADLSAFTYLAASPASTASMTASLSQEQRFAASISSGLSIGAALSVAGAGGAQRLFIWNGSAWV